MEWFVLVGVLKAYFVGFVPFCVAVELCKRAGHSGWLDASDGRYGLAGIYATGVALGYLLYSGDVGLEAIISELVDKLID